MVKLIKADRRWSQRLRNIGGRPEIGTPGNLGNTMGPLLLSQQLLPNGVAALLKDQKGRKKCITREALLAYSIASELVVPAA